jgi:hypothetical protein
MRSKQVRGSAAERRQADGGEGGWQRLTSNLLGLGALQGLCMQRLDLLALLSSSAGKEEEGREEESALEELHIV